MSIFFNKPIIKNMLTNIKSIISSFPEKNWDNFLQNSIIVRKNKKPIEHVDLNQKNTRFYIWVGNEGEETIYGKEYTQWLIAYGLKHIKENEELHITIVGKLRELLNTDREESINNFQQKENIKKIVHRDFPQYDKKIKVNYLENDHKELFGILEQWWVQQLKDMPLPELSKENINSLDIAIYLVHAVHKDRKLFQSFYKTMPKQRQEENKTLWSNDSDYYAVMEIAIRIAEYLQGKVHQVWPKRQIMFDQILHQIIEKETENNEIVMIQKLVHSVYNQGTYTWIYLDEKQIKQNKQWRLDTIKKNAKNIILGTLIGWMVVWWFRYKNTKDKEQQEEFKTELREKIKNLVIYPWFIEDSRGRIPMQGINYIEPFVMAYHESLSKIMTSRYGVMMSDKDIIDIRLLEYISEQSFWNTRNRDHKYQMQEKVSFIDTIFMKENRLLMKELWINNIPYQQLYDERNVIQNMQNYSGDNILMTNMTDSIINNNPENKKYHVKKIQEISSPWGSIDRKMMHLNNIWGKYITKDGTEYYVALYDPKWTFNRSILLAQRVDDYEHDVRYTTEAWQIVAQDYKSLLEKLDIDKDK